MRKISSFILTVLLMATVQVKATEKGDELRDHHFRLLCRSNISFLELNAPLVIADRNIDLKYLESTLDGAKIEWTNKPLKVDGVAVDAVNIPSKKLVIINRNSWDGLEQFSKSQLCLHELWGLAYNDQQDDRYFFSSQMVNRLRLSILRESMQLVKCIPVENKLDPVITINISMEFFAQLAANMLDDNSSVELAGHSQWVEEKGSVSTRTTSFLIKSKEAFSIQRFKKGPTRSFEELFIPLDESLTGKKSIYSESGVVIEEQRYRCGVAK